MTFTQVLSAIFCPQAAFNTAFDAQETFNNLDGQKYHTWRAVRRQNINELTSDILHIILYLTIALVTGPDQQQLDPKNVAKNQAVDVKDNYGIVYQVGIYVAWAFMLVVFPIIGILWYPIFQWFETPSSTEQVTETIANNGDKSTRGATYYLRYFNKYMYTFYGYMCLYTFALHLHNTILHVNSKSLSTSVSSAQTIDLRQTRKARLYLTFGMLLSLVLGAATMRLWFEQELVHVTVQEYAIIVVPTQLTIGITLASIYQAWFEKHRESSTTHEPLISEKDVDDRSIVEKP